MKAAYRFSDRFVCDISKTATSIICALNFRQSIEADFVRTAIDQFKLEVLDNELRRSVAERTEPLRTAILAYAFSKSGLQSTE